MKRLLTGSAIGAIFFILIIAFIVWMYSGETFNVHFATAGDAAQSGEFTRGWMPEVLLPDATDLQEWHDIDSNKVQGHFTLTESVVNRIHTNCQPAQDQTPWWRSTAQSIGTVRCGNFFLATDLTNHTGYFWNIPQ